MSLEIAGDNLWLFFEELGLKWITVIIADLSDIILTIPLKLLFHLSLRLPSGAFVLLWFILIYFETALFCFPISKLLGRMHSRYVATKFAAVVELFGTEFAHKLLIPILSQQILILNHILPKLFRDTNIQFL